jgi:hypothetical protein
MKKAVFTLLFALTALVAVWSQPKIAVLDAMIPQNMDPSVIVPTTEKIIERLVVSGRFTVLDRANIESVLKEREFQVSGMVTDQDVVTAGKYLGADFVVVAKISKVGDTYFISAKMINIKTGVIANQTSAQGEGKISTLIDLAGQVGEVLSGGAVTAQSATGESKDISKPSDQPKEKPKEKPVSPPMQNEPAPQIVGLSVGYSMDRWKATAGDSYGNYSNEINWNYATVNALYIGKFFQAGLGVATSLGGNYSETDTYWSINSSGDITATRLNVTMSLLGRLPITFGSLTLFALGGAEYDLNLSWKASDGTDLRAYYGAGSDTVKGLNHLFLQVGGGVQIAMSGKMYLIPEFIYGWKMKTQDDTDAENYIKTNYLYSSASAAEGKMDITVIAGFKL